MWKPEFRMQRYMIRIPEQAADIVIADVPCPVMELSARNRKSNTGNSAETGRDRYASEKDSGQGCEVCEAGWNTDFQHMYHCPGRKRRKCIMVL